MTRGPHTKDKDAPRRIALPTVIDLPRAGALRDEIAAARGAPLVLDAAGVERIGGLGQQLVLSAARSWQADGVAFAIAAPSTGFIASAATLGLDFTPFLEGDPI